VRIELGVRALDPSLVCRAPLRESPLSRPDAIAFARERGIPIAHTAERPYSIDANLWGRSIEAGVLEDPWNAPPEDAYAWTASPAAAAPVAQEIVIAFGAGEPSVDASSGAAMVAQLNVLGGAHGIGRIDSIEDRVVGLKSREVYECPAATILIGAHRALERLVLTRDELRFKALADRRYAELIYDGLWMQPLRTALDAFNGSFAARMTGEVRLRLSYGNATVVGLRSSYGLYREQLATYGMHDTFDHQAADGFIALQALPLEAYAASQRAPVGV
jgi:argininosuccinate synthase